MYCGKCGTQNADTATTCTKCGAPLATVPQTEPKPAGRVKNYLVQAILVTLFCCLPLGIVAIINASQVNSKQDSGDYNGALEKSNSAKKWCWISFWVGLAGVIIYFLISLIAGLSAV